MPRSYGRPLELLVVFVPSTIVMWSAHLFCFGGEEWKLQIQITINCLTKSKCGRHVKTPHVAIAINILDISRSHRQVYKIYENPQSFLAVVVNLGIFFWMVEIPHQCCGRRGLGIEWLCPHQGASRLRDLGRCAKQG